MLWLNKHARDRRNLSPYIDGRLTASEATALETHLASCEACRRELDELRAAVSVLHDMPQADPPRSFALTPQLLERKTADAARPLPALGLGMRLVGAGVAVAFAIVLVGDLTLGDNGGASQEAATEARVAEESDLARNGEKYSAEGREQQGATPLVPQADAGATACPLAAPTPAAGNGASGGAAGPASGGGASGGRGSGETPSATAAPQPAPSPSPTEAPATAPEVAAICGDASGGFVAPVAPAPASPGAADTRLGAGGNEATIPAASESNGFGGISTLRVVEIALGATLITILAGVVLESALRRRRTA